MKKYLPEIISRFVIGSVFIESGWGKFQDLSRVVSYFETLNIPWPQFQAPFVSGVELIAGAFILFGFKTRIASLPLIIIMLVALVSAKREDITDLSSLLGLSETLYIVILAWLVTKGSKVISIDSMVCKSCTTDSCTTSEMR